MTVRARVLDDLSPHFEARWQTDARGSYLRLGPAPW
jgi:hypothetical protein